MAESPDNTPRPAGYDPPPDLFDELDQLPQETPDPERLWGMSDRLQHIRRYALCCLTSPWAVLGATLIRVSCATEPNIQLPALVATKASLNLFVALVGASGTGKSGAMDVAEEMLIPRLAGSNTPIPIPALPLGSGEGLSDIYVRLPPRLPRRGQQEDGIGEDALGLGVAGAVQHCTRALVVAEEVDTIDAQVRRSGSTLMQQLRLAWSGGQLGHAYRDETKRIQVPKHAYRMGLLVGVQPGRGAALLDDADGGTPQRFLWLPATDPGLVENPEDFAEPLPVTIPQYVRGATFRVWPPVRQVVRKARLDRNKGLAEALDGHALLTRLKVAAALVLLHDGWWGDEALDISEQAWYAAGLVMAKSDQTRESVRQYLSEAAQAANVQQGRARATQEVIVAEVTEEAAEARLETRVQRLAAKLANRIADRGKTTEDRWVAHRVLNQGAAAADRKHLLDALARLEALGQVEVRDGGHHARHYRIRLE